MENSNFYGIFRRLFFLITKFEYLVYAALHCFPRKWYEIFKFKKEHMKGKKLELVFQNEGVASITIWNFNNAI